ncbi:transcriptional regulator family: bZIP [Aspergillus niger]|nr:transcriptional regulator family: bZIP [Aspergillus niger]
MWFNPSPVAGAPNVAFTSRSANFSGALGTLTSTSHQKTPLLDGSTIPPASHHPFAASPPSYPVPMHELTSRGTISDYSQRSYGSISSASSADSAGSYSHATRRPSDLLAQHPCSYPPDRETVEQQKRERFLERSRVAANKCRRKKKEHMRQLKSKCMDATQANTRLESEVSQLRSQILELKNELLQHSGCDDPGIKAHLAQMVASLSTPSASVVSTGASESDMVLSGGVSRRAESVASLWEANSEKVEEAAFGFKDMVVLPAAAAGGSKVGEGKQEDADADADAEPVKMTEGP